MNLPTELLDCRDRPFKIGDLVGCAFSYSRASVGHIRIGTLVEIGVDETYYYTEIVVKIKWSDDDKKSPGKVSPVMKYGDKSRWVLLTP